MATADVLQLLESNKNERGIEHWNRRDDELKSFGIGLTVLRKLAKQIGRDHELAAKLWKSDTYDARVLGLLIDEPKKLTREQAEIQVEQLHHGMLSHVFASCNATLAKTPYVVDLSERWMQSDDPMRRQCGYTLLYEISKDKRKSAPGEDFFLGHIAHIRATHATETHMVRMAMGGALIGVGKRSKVINAAARVAAREMGEIAGAPGCEPLNVMKHLTSPYITKKLGLD